MLRGSGAAAAEVQGEVTNVSGITSLPAVQTDADGNFILTDIPLALGDNTIAVVIEDMAGNRSKSASVRVVSGDPPSPPTGLAAADLGGFEVEVTWNANPEPNVVGYRLFRDGETLSETVPMFDLSAPQASSAGSPTFRAVDNNPSTYWAPNVFSGRPVAGEWIVVAFPEERWITDVEILWLSIASDPPFVYGASDYDIEAWDGTVWVPLTSVRDNTDARQTFALDAPYFTSRIRVFLRASIQSEDIFWPIRLAEVDVSHIPLLDTRVFNEMLPDGQYSYTATAVNDLGFESGPSDPAVVDLGDAIVLTATVVGSDVQLTWTPASSPEIVRYDVFRDGTKIGEVTDLADLRFVDSDRPNGTYRYFVRPVDGDGVAGSASNEEEVTVDVPVPPPPVLVSVDNVLGGQALDLLWEPGVGSTSVGYEVLRSTVSGGPYESAGMSAETSFRDESVTAGITYYYVIVALDIIGNPSLPSNELSGTPEDLVPPRIPVLHAPGFPGIPIAIEREPIDVTGTTEAGATVTVFRAGQAMGEVQARGELETNAAGIVAFEALMSPNGRYLWIREFPDRLFDFETGNDDVTPVLSIAVAWSPDSESVFYIDEFEREVRRYRISDGNDTEVLELDLVEAARPSPLDDRLAILGEGPSDTGLWLYDSESDELSLLLEDASFQIVPSAIFWSPDATRILFSSDFDTVEVVEVGSGDVTLLDDRGDVVPLGWSPDGQLALFSASNQIWAYDFEVGAATPVTSDARDQFDAAYSPDGGSIAIVFDGEGVFVLDPASGELEPSLPTFEDVDVLEWVKSGDLLVIVDGEPFRLRPPGVFTLPAVDLLRGDNAFTARADDAAGNRSELSEEMIVSLRVDNRPDLAIAFEDLRAVPAVARLGDVVRVSATVRNLGPVASAASDLSLALFGPVGLVEILAERVSVPALAPGAAFTLTRDVTETSTSGTFRLVATADPFDEIPEITEINNQTERTFRIVDGSAPLITAVTDRTSYSANEDVHITVEVFNPGDELTGRLVVGLEDADGFEVTTLLDDDTTLIFNETRTEDLVWNTETFFAGDYAVAARLLDAEGTPLVEGRALFEILESVEIIAGLTTDRASYAVGDTVEITAQVDYPSGNVVIRDAELLLQLRDAADGIVATWPLALGEMLPGASYASPALWESATNAPGPYRAELEVRRAGEELAQASTPFDLTLAPAQLIGSLTLLDTTVPHGQPAELRFDLLNTGLPLGAVPVRVLLQDPDTGQVLTSQERVVDLASGAAAGELGFATSSLGLQTYLFVLQAQQTPPAFLNLDIESFTVVDETPPEVSVRTPEEAVVVGAELASLLRAIDGLSPLRSVEIRLDGGEWQSTAPHNPVEGLFRRDLAGLGEGTHTLEGRATDRPGNTGTSAPVHFVVDLTPPRIVVSGVSDGDVFGGPVTPVIEIIELHPKSQSILLNGDPFVSGATVSAPGIYRLEVTAEDVVGLRSELMLQFEIATSTELVIDDVTVVEGEAAVFTLSLSTPAASAITVNTSSVGGGTATVDEDFTSSSALVSFAAGDTSASFTVPTLQDLLDEPDETIFVELSSPTGNVILSDAQGLGTIEDDDEPEMRLEKRDDPELGVSAGGEVSYEITLTNSGSSLLRDVLLSDEVPAETAVVPGSVVTDRGSVPLEAPVTVEIGDLLPGDVATVRFDVLVSATTALSEIANQATASSLEITVVSDDPDTAEPEDPTRTPLLVWNFTDETETTGLGTPGWKNGGLAWCDFNHDGFLDVLVNTEEDHSSGRSRLYFNQGDGTFRDVTETHAAGLTHRVAERSAICADIDNDGYLDFARNSYQRIEVYLNRGPEADPPWSFGKGDSQKPNQYFKSLPGGMNTEGMGWIDFDLDGHLDLIVDNHDYGIALLKNKGAPKQLLRRTGRGRYGLPKDARSGDYLAVADFDNDGWVDVLDRKEDQLDLWRNNRTIFEPNGSFEEQARNVNKGGVAFCDLDTDGDLDVFWTDTGENQIWRNHDGSFAPTGEPALSSGVDLALEDIDGVVCGDADNDGDLDLFLSAAAGPSYLFFNETEPGWDSPFLFRRDNRGIDVNADGEAVAFGDYDRDGDLDLLVNVGHGENQLWQSHLNDAGPHNYLVVRALRCLPHGRHRDDIGAAVRLFDEEGVTPWSPLQEVNGGRGHGSQDPAFVHFGLPRGPDATYMVEVRFLGDGDEAVVVRRTVVPGDLPGAYQILEVKSCDGASDPDDDSDDDSSDDNSSDDNSSDDNSSDDNSSDDDSSDDDSSDDNSSDDDSSDDNSSDDDSSDDDSSDDDSEDE